MRGLDHGRKHNGLPGQGKRLLAGMSLFRRVTLQSPAEAEGAPRESESYLQCGVSGMIASTWHILGLSFPEAKEQAGAGICGSEWAAENGSHYVGPRPAQSWGLLEGEPAAGPG